MFIDDGEIPLPPILFGVLGTDKTKKTVLIYGHLDVQPAEKSVSLRDLPRESNAVHPNIPWMMFSYQGLINKIQKGPI